MKNILIPTDFSNNAWNALFTALKLYQKVECHFYVLNSQQPTFVDFLANRSQPNPDQEYASMQVYSNKELGKMFNYLTAQHKNTNHSFKMISTTKDLTTSIKDMILEKDIEMTVMGTKGATKAKEVFLGSNTVKIMKAISNCPIIAVPGDYDFQRLEKVVFPTDFTKPYKIHELRPLINLAKLWKTQVIIFEVGKDFRIRKNQLANRESLAKKLIGISYDFRQVEFKKSVAASIQYFSKSQEADMIVLIDHNYSFIKKMTREPVIKKVAFQTNTPLLVLPEL